VARLGEPGLKEKVRLQLKKQQEITTEETYTSNQIFWCTSIATVLIGISAISFSGRIFHQIYWYVQNDSVQYDMFKDVVVFKLTLSLELVDQILWVSTLLLTGVLLTPKMRELVSGMSTGLSERFSLTAYTLMAISIMVVPSGGRYVGILWDGYGIQIFILTVLLIPLIIFLQKSSSDFLGGGLSVLIVPLIVYAYVPTIVQPLWAIKELYHSSFVMNEVISQSRGIIPSSDSAAQYTSLMGFPLMVFAKVFRVADATSLQNSAAIYLSLLAGLTFFLILKIVRNVAPNKLSSFSMVIVILYICVTPNGSLTGGITAVWSALPVRALPAVIVGLQLLSKSAVNKSNASLLGITAALASINNFEFGTPTFVATAVVYFTLCRQTSNGVRRYFSVFIIGFMSTWICYVAVLGFASSGFVLSYYLLFVLAFGKGFLSIPMPTVGPHIFFLSVLAAGVVMGGRVLTNPRFESEEKNDRSLANRAATASLFFGLMGLLTFPYFVNRSTTPSLAIFHIFVAIIVIATFTLLEIDKIKLKSRRSVLMLLLMVTPQALLLGSIIQMPNGFDEWSRVADLQSTTYSDRLAEIEQVVSDSEDALNRDIDFFSIGQGNLFLGSDEMQNISLIDDPSELNDPLLLGSSMLVHFCRHLDENTDIEKQYILVENFFETDSGLPLCRKYRNVLTVSEKFSVVVRANR
jgi:hypothetical protein